MRQRVEHDWVKTKSSDQFHDILREHEQDGWELISVMKGFNWFHFFFSRPVRPSQLRRKGENNAAEV